MARALAAMHGLLVAGTVVLKAVRDATFLSDFDATSLPYLYLALAVVVGLSVWGSSRLWRRVGPLRLARVTALGGAASLLALAPFVAGDRVVGVVFCLWTAIAGTLVFSNFWALLGQLFGSGRPREVRARAPR